MHSRPLPNRVLLTWLFVASAILIVSASTPTGALTAEQEKKLLASDWHPDHQFGWSVDVRGDTALIGADLDDDAGVNAGAAYVFVRIGGEWGQEAKLVPTGGTAPGRFGNAVALDGDTAVIGAFVDDEGGHNAGAAYVFTRGNGHWSQRAKLLAADAAPNAFFGCSVDIAGDTAIIGAYSDNDGNAAGAAYVFVGSGSAWSQQAKLMPSDGAVDDSFGQSVALDGVNTAVIGASLDDDNGENSGSAYVFTRSGSQWTEQAKLLASDGAEFDLFGTEVALDGDTAVIGAFRAYAYVFVRVGGVWVEQAHLTPGRMGTPGGPQSGPVDVDGDVVLLGDQADYGGAEFTGAAYLFTRSGDVWTEQVKLTASDAAEQDRFGFAVALDGDAALISAVYDDDNGTDSGSAYVFRLYDDDVPATGIAGSLVLLLAVLGAGAFIMRRRAAT